MPAGSTIDIGLGTLPYLLFQFMPIILLGVFLLMSLLHQDIRAVIYSSGLLIAVIITVLIGKSSFAKKWFDQSANTAFMLTPENPISPNISLNLVMYVFTLTYFLTGMIQYKAVKENAPTIAFFAILIAAEFFWRAIQAEIGVSSILSGGMATVIGFVVGIVWGGMIVGTKNKKLFYLVGMNTRETCTATKQKMKCTQVSP